MIFKMPRGVKTRASKKTQADVKISVTPNELLLRMKLADRALNGDSNDKEHDALFDLREWLSEIFEDPNRRNC